MKISFRINGARTGDDVRPVTLTPKLLVARTDGAPGRIKLGINGSKLARPPGGQNGVGPHHVAVTDVVDGEP